MTERAAGIPVQWSKVCLAFLAHWKSLRGEGIVPTTENFLENVQPEFAPHTYAVDLVNDMALVRLQGTELDERWSARLTGRDLHLGMPDMLRTRSLANMRMITSHPCGYLARNTYQTSLNRTVTSDLIQLPLAVRKGRPPRVVCLTVLDRADVWEETVTNFKTLALAWADIGAGVPADPPLDLLA